MGHQVHAQNGIGVLADLIDAVSELHAPALAAPSGVDLRLHDKQCGPFFALQLLSRVDCFVDCLGHNPSGNRNAVVAKEAFCLIFVELHGAGRI